MPHQRGPITSTFTGDWFLREGQGRELLGEWMKKTAVKSQDQRRMLQANSHTFPTNSWIHKITKGRESDRCDICRTLWTAEGRFKTEEEIPKQTLGHIQHTCSSLSESDPIYPPSLNDCNHSLKLFPMTVLSLGQCGTCVEISQSFGTVTLLSLQTRPNLSSISPSFSQSLFQWLF
jgi:hypothetical protein